MELTEQYRKIYLALDEFYSTMFGCEKISDKEEREGKQVTKTIMTVNDIQNIFKEQEPVLPDVKSNILERIKRHQNDIVFWKKQLASADNVTESESCIRNIKNFQEREGELEMVLKYCL